MTMGETKLVSHTAPYRIFCPWARWGRGSKHCVGKGAPIGMWLVANTTVPKKQHSVQILFIPQLGSAYKGFLLDPKGMGGLCRGVAGLGSPGLHGLVPWPKIPKSKKLLWRS